MPGRVLQEERVEKPVNTINMGVSYMRCKPSVLKPLFCIVIILIQILSCGCVYRVDIQSLAIINALGIDINEEGEYKVSFQILQPAGKDSGGGGGRMAAGGREEAGFIYFEGFGDTIYNAISSINNRTSRKPHFGQMHAVVIGEALAERGVAPIIDFLGRFAEIRSNLMIFVTEGKAETIVSAPSKEHSISAETIDELAMRQIESGMNPITYLKHLIDTLAGEDLYPIATVLKLSTKREADDDATFRIDGIAAFEEDKLVGYVSAADIKGFQYIHGRIRITDSVVVMPSGESISLEIKSTSSKIQTKVEEGKTKVSINIKETASVREMPGKFDPGEEPGLLDAIGRLEEEKIKKQVKKTLEIIQKDIGVDIADIGGEVYRQHPKEWNQIKDTWKEEFPTLAIEVNAQCTVKATGLMAKPAH
jgi:spore germination protein KC